MDDKLDDAVHAAMKALGLDPEQYPDAADLMNDALRVVIEDFDLEEEIG